jgi:hypothetical protein
MDFLLDMLDDGNVFVEINGNLFYIRDMNPILN